MRKRLTDADRQLADDIAQYLTLNIRYQVTQEALVNKFYLSRTRLNELFFIIHQTTIRQFTVARRMETALDYLQQSEKSIEEIARLTGYHHRSNFTRRFNEYYSQSPQHIKALRRRENNA